MEERFNVYIDFSELPEFFTSEELVALVREQGLNTELVTKMFLFHCPLAVQIGRDLYINLSMLEQKYGTRN